MTTAVRVLCLSSLPTVGAGNRVRIEQYRPLLRTMGIEIVMSPFFDERTARILYARGHFGRKLIGTLRGASRRFKDVARASEFDLVLVYRESAPLGPPLFERALARLHVPYVFDFDDAIFLGPVHPSNQRWSWIRPRARVAEAVARAELVMAGNEYLAVWARGHNDRVVVIPSAVDTDRFRPRPKPLSTRLVIGWIGSSTTAPYLRLLDEALKVIAAEHDIVFRVIGGTYPHPSIPIEVRGWDIEREPVEVSEFDIGVLPEPDDAWTRGKGAFKAMLCMAAGVPVVASRVGVNETVIGDGGYCVTDTAGWISALGRLLTDSALRRDRGSNGRARVEALYSTRVQGPRLAEALRTSARRPGPRS